MTSLMDASDLLDLVTKIDTKFDAIDLSLSSVESLESIIANLNGGKHIKSKDSEKHTNLS